MQNPYITLTPVVSNGVAYAAGDVVGTLLTVYSVNNFFTKLIGISISDASKQSVPMHVVLFDSNPSGSTFTDNAAMAPVTADIPKIIKHIPVTSYSSFSANSVGSADCEVITRQGRSSSYGGELYAVLVAQAAGTYTSTSALTVRFAFESGPSIV